MGRAFNLQITRIIFSVWERNAIQQLKSRCHPGVLPLTQGRLPFIVCSPPSHSLSYYGFLYMMSIKYTTYRMVVNSQTIQTAFLLQIPKIKGRGNRCLNLPKDFKKGGGLVLNYLLLHLIMVGFVTELATENAFGGSHLPNPNSIEPAWWDAIGILSDSIMVDIIYSSVSKRKHPLFIWNWFQRELHYWGRYTPVIWTWEPS